MPENEGLQFLNDFFRFCRWLPTSRHRSWTPSTTSSGEDGYQFKNRFTMTKFHKTRPFYQYKFFLLFCKTVYLLATNVIQILLIKLIVQVYLNIEPSNVIVCSGRSLGKTLQVCNWQTLSRVASSCFYHFAVCIFNFNRNYLKENVRNSIVFLPWLSKTTLVWPSWFCMPKRDFSTSRLGPK